MDKIMNQYQQCISKTASCGGKLNCIQKDVCQDKLRNDLGDYAMKYGGNNLWPYQNANFNPVPYFAVRDMDRFGTSNESCFQDIPENNPFSLPPRQITGGTTGAYNRIYPYNYVYKGEYGGLLKCTCPATRGPLY